MSDATPPLADAAARRRIATDLDTSLFVEAAAGTGKTSALVARIVALLRHGRTTLDRIVAVTFTEKAAGEMKLRVRGEIERVRGESELAAAERQRLDAALAHLEVARIHTIHGFCADLLHERPVEARVDPLFEVASEDAARALLERAFDGWLQAALADPPEGLRRFLRRRPARRRDPSPTTRLRDAALRLLDHRDFPAPWRRPAFDREGEIDALVEELAALGALARRAREPEGDWLAKNLAEVERFAAENALRESVRGRDHDALEASLRELRLRAHWNWRGAPRRPYGEGLERAEVAARRDAARARLDALLERADADLAALLHEELRPVVERYEEEKRRAGRLDFLDLLVRARDLVRDHRGVREELQRRFTHLFVDEFQDTDPLQAELLLLLCADDPEETDWRRVRPTDGKLFVVGDPKQSVYRFRRADVTVYQAVKRQVDRRQRADGGGAEVLQLTTSFRARPALQSLVNAAFAPAMRGSASGSQADYVPLSPFRAEATDQPAVVVLPVPRPYSDWGRVVRWRVEESYPDAVGAFVAWLVHESGWTVEERGARVPVASRHVCLLFRRFRDWSTDVTRAYVRALEARRVPHVLVGGRSFHEREEVLALRNALAAVEWPDDELRVFATLRGPFFALGDDALLAWRHRVGRFHALRRLAPEETEALDAREREVADALAVLAELHRHRNRRPAAETLVRLLQAVRAHAGVAIWPTGEQALANCLRLVDVARRFERGGAASFRAFVEHLEAESERGEARDAPVVEEGTEGVRIMTVHRAKGLEFPVVVLADPTCHLVGRNPSRHVDPARGLWAEPLCGSVPQDLRDAAEAELARDGEEALRLAYVAATRARDLLVVPGCGDEPVDGWLGVLAPAVTPPREAWRGSREAPGCPAFGEDSVRERPPGGRRRAADSVRPGLHRPEAGDHGVVWWDPSALDLDREEEVGLRQQRILEADAGERQASAGAEAHARWQAQRAAALAAGAAPSCRVAPVTELAAEEVGRSGEPAGPAAAVETLEVPDLPAQRPSGARFGTLVHAVLASVALDADAERLRAAARSHGRLLGAPEDEVAAAASAASAALAHPLLRRAAACERAALRRETPVLLRLPDGRLAEGVVDLAFRETSADGTARWTVVDFKTARDAAAFRTQHEAQVRLYAAAIAAATGEPARGVVLAV